MRTYTSDELDQMLGKGSFWNPVRTVNMCHYISGVEGFDEYIDPKNRFQVPAFADFRLRETGFEIMMKNTITKSYSTGVPFSKLVSIKLEDKEQLTISVQRDPYTYAIIGDILNGLEGAFLGSIYGSGTDTVNLPMPDLFLSFAIGDSPGKPDRMILFSCQYKNKQDVIDFFSKYAPKYFNVTQSEPPQQEPTATPTIIQKTYIEPDPMDQLVKLAKLKDQGIITEDEFVTKKKQLLGL